MRRLLSAICLILPAVIYAGSVYHVTTTGSAGNSGSSGSPWNLTSALNQPSAVHPGDTIWVHGGTYAGTYSTNLNGTSSQPIIVRNWNNERVTIDGGNSGGNPIITLGGSYTWYWGLEITSSAPNKISSQATSWPTDIMYGEGIMIKQGGSDGTGCKFINLVIHDTRQAISSWKEAVNSEVYGCVVYDNGWIGSDRPHGHNFYIQNVSGTKLFSDNFILRAYSHNIQSYGSTASNEDNETFTGNIGINGGERNFMLGGDNVAHNPSFLNNVMYSDGARAGTNNLYLGYPTGYSPGTDGAVVTGNYFAGGTLTFNLDANMTFSGNTVFHTGLIGDVPSMGDNILTTAPPQSNSIIIRPNKYEPARANLVVLNWTGLDAVDVDLSSVVRTGDPYVIRDAQNYYGAPVASGTYAGGKISIPMTGGTVPGTIGNDPRGVSHTARQCGTFVIFGSGTPLAQAPTAVTTPASGVTATSATVNGSVNPSGLSTTYHFDYGTTSGYGSTTAPENAGTGTGSSAVSAVLSGLTPATLYHYRIAATNSGGTTNSSDGTLTTGAAAGIPPVVSSSAATGITPTGAQLNGSVNPSGLATTYHFDYGTTSSYGSTTAPVNAGAGTGSSAVSAVLSGLTPATLYHYRIAATNSGGTTNSSDRTLTTAIAPPAPAVPVVTTLAASNISATGATLAGTVNPNGLPAAYHFEYGLTNTYAYSTPADNAGPGSSPVNVSAVLTNLTPGTLYHYRLVATNSSVTVNGADMTLTAQSLRVHQGQGTDPHALSQNYPNPFNPSTQIQYDLSVASDVSMKVYNALGAEVATLFEGFQNAGAHIVQWDGKGFVSGVYFCVLKSGGMISAKRMILMK